MEVILRDKILGILKHKGIFPIVFFHIMGMSNDDVTKFLGCDPDFYRLSFIAKVEDVLKVKILKIEINE